MIEQAVLNEAAKAKCCECKFAHVIVTKSGNDTCHFCNKFWDREVRK